MACPDPTSRPLRSILRLDPRDMGDGAPPAHALLFDVAANDERATAATLKVLHATLDDPASLRLLRVAPPDDGGADALAALVQARPDAVVASRAETGADLQHIGAILAVEEAKAGFDEGAIGIVAVAETAASLFELIGFAPATRRLVAIGWDAEALAADFGGETAREDGRFTDPIQTARTLTLAAAADARLPAIDTPFATRDRDAFAREAERARRDGFAGKIALDAAQAAILEEVFG